MSVGACDAAGMGEPRAREDAADLDASHRSGRLVAWWKDASPSVPGWIFPVVVIVVTGLLGRGPHNQELVCWWLGLVGGIVAYHLVFIAFEPALYAKRLASAIGVVAALAVAQLLLQHVGAGMLST
jgi:hypothetical protein